MKDLLKQYHHCKAQALHLMKTGNVAEYLKKLIEVQTLENQIASHTPPA